MKKCPYCAEEIQDAAIVCRFCGRDLPGINNDFKKDDVIHPEGAIKKKAFPVFLPALGLGILIASLITWAKMQIEPYNVNDLVFHYVTNVGIYGLLYTAIVWFWRVVIKKTATAFGSDSGCTSLLFFILCIIGVPLIAFTQPFITTIDSSVQSNPTRSTVTQAGQDSGMEFFPSPTPLERIEIRPTPTIPNWPLQFHEYFDKKTSLWYVGLSSFKEGDILSSISDGKYRWEFSQKTGNGFYFYQPIKTNAISDFVIAIRVQCRKCENGDYGFLLRYQDEKNFYFLTVKEDRNPTIPGYELPIILRFGINFNGNSKVLNTESYYHLKEFTYRGMNTITVFVDGTHFIIFINGELIAQYDDDRISSGLPCLRAGVYTPTPAVDTSKPDFGVDFDTVEIYYP